MKSTSERAVHTPTPWMIKRTEGMPPRIAGPIKDNGKRSVVCIAPMMADAETSEADARLIVAAVNSYAAHCEDPVEAAESDLLGDALKALEDLAGWVDRVIIPNYTPRKPQPENCKKAMEAARAVLARGRK